MRHRDQSHPGTIWRPLTPDERSLLLALTSQPFDGAEILRSQIDLVLAQQGCGCGCGTINLQCDESQAEPAPVHRSPVPGGAHVLNGADQVVGGLLLFVRDGYLNALEIFTFDDPAPLPPLERVRPYVRDLKPESDDWS